MSVYTLIRFLVGWPIWFLCGISLLWLLYRAPLPFVSYRRIAIALSIIITIHSAVAWSALLFSHGVIPPLWAKIYTNEVVVASSVMSLMVVMLFVGLWRQK